MPVKSVPTVGWTKRDVAATIRRVAEDHRKAIATRVRAEMDRQGFTVARLARESNVAEKTVSRLINARMDPRYDTLSRIAKALNVLECDLRGEPPIPLGLGSDDAESPEVAELRSQVSGLDEQVRLLRAELSVRDAEVLSRIEAVRHAIQDLRHPPRP